jgi:hypothetical protein
MRWVTRRAVFVICFSLGTTAWYLVAQRQSTPARALQTIEAQALRRANAQVNSRQQTMDESPDPSIKFGPVEPMYGYANAKTVVLRESPDPTSSVVAKVKSDGYDSLVILGATRDFLHVKISPNADNAFNGTERAEDYEGWTPWGTVMPELTAIVLDAESGEIVSRVPLSDGLSSVAFSPDNTRALFYHYYDGIGSNGYEVRTSDYTLTRGLTSVDNNYFGTIFYGPADGRLYAAVKTANSPSKLEGNIRLMRIDEDGAMSVPHEFNLNQSNFAISPDRLTGFVLREENSAHSELMVDVIDLSTMQVRNTFTLMGENFPSDSSEFVLNRDGSELYIRLSASNGLISVIDTRTGRHVRELKDSGADNEVSFGRESLGGDSLLLKVWESGEGEMYNHSHTFWVGAKGRVAAEKGIDFITEAGGRRYAVNDEGTRLFRLDTDNHIQERWTIARPELRKGAPANSGLSVFGFSASPDGKRLVMFIGEEHGC